MFSRSIQLPAIAVVSFAVASITISVSAQNRSPVAPKEELVKAVVKGGVKGPHRGGGKGDHTFPYLGLCFCLWGRLEWSPATPVGRRVQGGTEAASKDGHRSEGAGRRPIA